MRISNWLAGYDAVAHEAPGIMRWLHLDDFHGEVGVDGCKILRRKRWFIRFIPFFLEFQQFLNNPISGAGFRNHPQWQLAYSNGDWTGTLRGCLKQPSLRGEEKPKLRELQKWKQPKN